MQVDRRAGDAPVEIPAMQPDGLSDVDARDPDGVDGDGDESTRPSAAEPLVIEDPSHDQRQRDLDQMDEEVVQAARPEVVGVRVEAARHDKRDFGCEVRRDHDKDAPVLQHVFEADEGLSHAGLSEYGQV